MHDFKYRKNRLYCEGVSVAEIAKSVGTPFYLYSHNTIAEHYRKLSAAFKEINPLICYSVKANSNLTIIRTLVREGAGLDIVSGGELYRARLAGADVRKIVYAGVGKTEAEIDAGLKAGIFFFNCESISELKLIDERAGLLRKRPAVAIRINPNITAKTHKYITTGKEHNKFGMDFDAARKIFLHPDRFPNLRIKGVHIHIGSQIVEARPFMSAIMRAKDFVFSLRNAGVEIEYLNIGGGLGIIYKDEKPQTAMDYARAIIPILKNSRLKIILEPGRFIVGNAGILVTKVIYLKETRVKNFIIVDAGMNDLVRPTLYEAYHEIVPVIKAQSSKLKAQKFDVVGPICESGDFFALNRQMAKPAQGDLLAIMGAGAYGFSMASNYNSRPKPCEIMVLDTTFRHIRKREACQDLVKGEIF